MTRLAALALLAVASPLAARESLGVYDSWAAFRDASPARCYAIAKAGGKLPAPAYATISTWPGKGVRGAVHIVLSREVPAKATVRLTVGEKRFTLVTKGRNAWAADPQSEAAIIAAIRSATRMSVSGAGFTDRYFLSGAATAIDAATVGCASR
ncbi:hypothetical protein [Erythrobacter sp. WG]|uniref:hypothetical protein n=1 Tax=Erythrobacter sp. WG TaxID=2985510 RepID=UPI00227131BF|nr:hypothetical protein [Erythrobacter sp. WG]MCX9146811.1 hypothetical protein [Erythrobacter sp. WG]